MLLLCLLILCQDQNAVDNWVSIEPPRIGAKFKMPTVPMFFEETIKPVRDQPEIIVRTRATMLPSGKENLTFTYHDEHETPKSRFEIKDTLDGAVTGAIALVNGDLIRQDEIFIKNHKCRDFVYQCELDDVKLQTTHKMKIRSRVILVRNRLFSMNYIAEAKSYDDKLAEQYFNSFELVKKNTNLAPKPRPGRARELAQEESNPSQSSQ